MNDLEIEPEPDTEREPEPEPELEPERDDTDDVLIEMSELEARPRRVAFGELPPPSSPSSDIFQTSS